MTGFDKTDRIINRTANRISAELDRMIGDLPEDAAFQMALEQVIVVLADLQPDLMRRIIEDEDIRESYYAAVARRPATPHHDFFLRSRRKSS
jgi:hypothetical protein